MPSPTTPSRTPIIRHGALAALLIVAGCAANPMTPTPPPAPPAPPPAPMVDLGTPSATFVYLPEAGISEEGSATGNSGGTGILSFKGKRYTFTAAGVTAGRLGSSPGPVSGEVYNLTNLRDINGTYTSEVMAGGGEAILKNPQGVTIHVKASTRLQMAPQSVSLRLNYR